MRYKAVLFYPLIITLMVCLLPASGTCEMQSLNEAEMHDIYAEGFSAFTLTPYGGLNEHATMDLWFNINTAQYTTIETLKLGYHDYNDPNPPGLGWDHHWNTVRIGGPLPEDDFYTEGFYIRADFANFEDPINRQLKSVTYGVDIARGQIHADFESFSGIIGADPPLYRENLGPGTIQAAGGGGFELSLSVTNTPYIGYWMTFEDSTFIAD
jgi:hypothetical protein